MPLVLGVAACGVLGVLARYGLDSWIEQHSESVFPWATFTINVTGCLAVGFFIAALVDRHRMPQWIRTGLVVGFCGGFTTFSTFAQETLDLFEEGDHAVAVATIGANVLLGLGAVWLGARLGRTV